MKLALLATLIAAPAFAGGLTETDRSVTRIASYLTILNDECPNLEFTSKGAEYVGMLHDQLLNQYGTAYLDAQWDALATAAIPVLLAESAPGGIEGYCNSEFRRLPELSKYLRRR